MNTVLKTENLTKRFKEKTAVNQVNMTINKGEIYGFVGKNGAGKTTFMRMVLGMAFPNNGSISLFDGMPLDKARKKIGSLIEAPALYKNCTAYENLSRFAILFGGSRNEVKEILSFVGLDNTGSKNCGQFSLGMKQRLGIAIAMLGNPEFLVLDEPINGLDPEGIAEVRDIILKLNKEKNITFLISSHLLEELSKITTKYGFIKDGSLIEEITPQNLYNKCSKKLRFAVDNVPKAVEVLGRVVPKQDIIAENGYINLQTAFERSAELNKLLCSNDVAVSEIIVQTKNLENYFLERIGDIR